jgi:hypothetical protein
VQNFFSTVRIQRCFSVKNNYWWWNLGSSLRSVDEKDNWWNGIVSHCHARKNSRCRLLHVKSWV